MSYQFRLLLLIFLADGVCAVGAFSRANSDSHFVLENASLLGTDNKARFNTQSKLDQSHSLIIYTVKKERLEVGTEPGQW